MTWKTTSASSNNKLFYKPTAASTWLSKNATYDTQTQTYLAIANQSVPSHYKVQTTIGGNTYESAIYTQPNYCPEFEGGSEAVSLDTKAFLKAHPNPFNPVVTLTYGVPSAAFVELVIYDATGARVRSLINATESQGVHAVTWDGTNDAGVGLASGIYFARGRIGGSVFKEKLMLLK